MKIIGINCSDSGSSGTIALDLLNKAFEEGNSVCLACADASMEIHANIERHLICKCKFVRSFNNLVSKLFGNDGFCNYIETYILLNWLKKEKPNVVHIHTLHGYFINVKILMSYLKKRSDIKVVWTFHDCWPFTGKCTHFINEKCYKWQSKCGGCPNLKQYPKSFCLDRTSYLLSQKKKIFKNFDNLTIVAVSDWLNDFLDLSICKNNHHHKIYNYVSNYLINSNSVCPASLDFEIIKDKFIVFSAAYPWSKEKGIDDIIKVAHNMLGVNMVFIVAGVESEKTSMSDNIIILPRLSQEEMKFMYLICDVFLNPSKQETFGMTNIEAQKFGKPVIIKKISGGALETVIPNITGYLYEDVLELENILKNCINKKIEQNNIIANANKFSFMNTYSQYKKIYFKSEKGK